MSGCAWKVCSCIHTVGEVMKQCNGMWYCRQRHQWLSHNIECLKPTKDIPYASSYSPSPFYWHRLTRMRTWFSNYINSNCYVFIHPCPNFNEIVTKPPLVNSFWPSDAISSIRWQRSGSTLAQVMACCLTVPSHYLNQCWLIISEVQWHS